METFKDDLSYISKKIGLQDINMDLNKNKRKGGHSRDVVKEYFKGVTPENFSKLEKMFKEDFLMFGYSLKGYI